MSLKDKKTVSKKPIKKADEDKKKKKKRILFWVLLSISTAAIIGGAIATAIIIIKNKDRPIPPGPTPTVQYTITVDQESSSKGWQLSVNGNKTKYIAKQDETIKAVVSPIDGKEQTETPTYLMISHGSQRELIQLQKETIEEKESYTCQFDMKTHAYDMTVSVVFYPSPTDPDANVTVKEDSKTFIVEPLSLHDPLDENVPVEMYNVADPTETYSFGRDKFNKELWIGNKIDTIYAGFLLKCTGFNSKIHFENNTLITTIGDSFMEGCTIYNQSTVLPTTVTKIGKYFMNNAKAFNNGVAQGTSSPINLPSVTEIGESFMYSCDNFNQQVSTPAVKVIYANYLAYCPKFSQNVILPSTLEYFFTTGFLCGDVMMDKTITVETSTWEMTDSPSACAVEAKDKEQPMYKNGITIDGARKNEFYNTFGAETGPTWYRNLKKV